MSHRILRGRRSTFLVSDSCHPQTIAVVQTRAQHLGIKVIVGKHEDFDFNNDVFGALVQYPTTDGRIPDYAPLCEAAHSAGALSSPLQPKPFLPAGEERPVPVANRIGAEIAICRPTLSASFHASRSPTDTDARAAAARPRRRGGR